MIVVDASVVVDVLLNRSPTGIEVARRLSAEAGSLLAPHLIDAEIGQVLRRFWLSRAITAERAATALDDYSQMPIARYPHWPLLARAFEMRGNVTFYDALYLALAEATGAPLLTADRRLADVPGVSARVDVV